MRNVLVCWCVATGLVGAAPAFAQADHGKPLIGWSCRMLNLTEAQSMDFHLHIPLRAEPSKGSPPVGYAMETVAIETSVPAVNGFVPAMFPTGRQVWIASDVLKPWHAAANPSARCVPVTKSNGKPGFDYLK